MMAMISDQHLCTIYRDFHHINTVVLHQLSHLYLYSLVPNSFEYNNLVGNGVFHLFPHVIYAADVVKVCPNKC